VKRINSELWKLQEFFKFGLSSSECINCRKDDSAENYRFASEAVDLAVQICGDPQLRGDILDADVFVHKVGLAEDADRDRVRDLLLLVRVPRVVTRSGRVSRRQLRKGRHSGVAAGKNNDCKNS